MTSEAVRRYFSKMGKKGGKKRHEGTSFRERSEMMKKVRAAGVEAQRIKKEENGG